MNSKDILAIDDMGYPTNIDSRSFDEYACYVGVRTPEALMEFSELTDPRVFSMYSNMTHENLIKGLFYYSKADSMWVFVTFEQIQNVLHWNPPKYEGVPGELVWHIIGISFAERKMTKFKIDTIYKFLQSGIKETEWEA